MPRRCPSEVITHRIEFGTAERQQIKKFARAYNRDKWLENVANIACAGLIGGGIYLGFKYGGYLIGEGLDLAGNVKDGLNGLNNAIRGLNPDGTEATVEGTNIHGETVDIPVPLSGTFVGGASKKLVEFGVWLPNPLTGEVPGTIPWFYRNRPWA